MFFRNKPICQDDECSQPALFMSKGKRQDELPTHCELHESDDYISFVMKQCSKCNLEYFITSDICNVCHGFEVKKKYLKHKELELKSFLEGKNIEFIHDKVYERECTKRRPDFIIQDKFKVIIIEVDENQHKSYNQDCEIPRMANIFQSYDGRKVVFIRYNPDNYRVDGKLIRYNKKIRQGLLLNALLTLENIDEFKHSLSYIELFYDEFVRTDYFDKYNQLIMDKLIPIDIMDYIDIKFKKMNIQ